MRKRGPAKRVLSLILALAMCFSLLPGAALADGETGPVWTKVGLADIQTADTVAVVMHGAVTDQDYVLLNNGGTSTYGPAGAWDPANTAETTWQWNVEAVEGGYVFHPAGDSAVWLYCTDNNNGLRVGSTEDGRIWSIDEASGYLKCTDSGGNTRYLGVYDNNNGAAVATPNFRTYKNTTGNTKDQTLTFYKLSDGTGQAPDPDPEPPADGRPADGDVVAVYHPASGMAMTGTASGKKLAGTAGTVEDGKLTVEEAAAMLTVAVDENGIYTFAADGKYLTSGETGGSLSFAEELTDCGRWNVEAAENGTYYIKNVGANYNGSYNQSLEYYSGFTTFGHKDTDVYQFQFFTDVAVAEPEPGPDPDGTVAALVTDAGTLAAGDRIVIVASGYDAALSTEQKTNNRGEAAVTKNDSEQTVTFGSDTQIITLEAGSTADTFALHVDGGYLYAASSSSNWLRTEETLSENSSWTITIDGAGAAAFAAQGANTRNLLRYNSTSKLFSCYASGQQDVSIYRLGADPEPPADGRPADGDVVAVYHPASGMAMTGTASGKKLAGTAGTVEDGKLTVEEAAAMLTVAVDENGVYTFAADGKYLTSGETGGSLSFAEELTDCGRWNVEAAENGTYYIKNVGANYNGSYNQSLEYYSGFTTYGHKDTDVYQFQFFTDVTVAGSAPETPVADGTYVIWAPAYNMALSSVYSGYYNTGVEVALTGETLTGYSAAEIWTVTNNDDGSISISYDGQNLAMADSFSSLTLGEVNDRWVLEDAGGGTYYVKNSVRGSYIEWYASKSNWSGYGTIAAGSEGMFALRFTPAEAEEPDVPETIADGTYVIWAPVYGMALSSTTNSSNYYLGVSVSGTIDAVSGYGNTELWTVTGNGDGTYAITQNGLYLGTNASNYLTVGEDPANKAWVVEKTDDGYYNLKCGSRYLEWYASYSDWSMYGTISDSSRDLFALWFTPGSAQYETDASVVESIAAWGGGGPYDETENARAIQGDRYTVGDMLDENAVFTIVANGAEGRPYQATSTSTGGTNYYMGGENIGKAEGDYMQFAVSTAGWGDMTLSFRLRATKAAPGSFQLQYSADGGATFHNFNTGEYSYAYTKYTSDGSSEVTGGGSIADGVARTSVAATYYVSFSFDVPAGAENAEKLLIRLAAGTDRADGGTGAVSGNIRIDSVILSGSPIVDDGITGYVTVTPDGVDEDQAAGTELTMTCATENAVIYYRFDGGAWQTYDADSKPVLPDTLPTNLEVYAASTGRADSITRIFTYAAGTVQAVKMSPNGGGVYIADENEAVEVTLSCDTEGAVIWYNTGEQADGADVYREYTAPIVLNKGFGSLTVKAYAVKDGFKDSAVTTRTFTERSSDTYNLYFGQLHSHTSYSDGAGTAEEAYRHASTLGEEWNIDFLAVTDHSNSFDNADSATISDGSVSAEWVEGNGLAQQYTTDTFVGLFGFEMTWSNGLGHINTFNTGGFQSRTQSLYTTYSTALQNYYATLKTVSDSLSQFNHPGTTFGDFSDFAYYDEEIDNLITLIEVGNGEGAIGSSGYFPSYEYYTRALDKGWHVAPSNNQDNHKGNWGDSNTGRTVVLADELTQDAIYDAMRNYRVYATEDLNLEIRYTLDGSVMGSILDGASGETVKISVGLSDADDTGSAKVEVIVNGGLSLTSASAVYGETVTFEVPADYSYYYIKVTQADGDIAVTAPVWIGEVEAVGISSLSAGSELTMTGEEQTFTLELYNNENSALAVESIVFTDKATGEILYTDSTITSVGKLSTASCTFTHTFETDGIVTITATVKGTLNGVEKTYTQDLELTVMPARIVSRIVVDGTHFNDYITGYYGGNMSNMTAIAAEGGVKVEIAVGEITAETLEDCSLLVISAPARKNGTANAGEYTASTFSDEFIQLVAEYVKTGGSVVVCGLADYQDKGAVNGADGHAAAQINKLLAAIGSTMSINDDEVYDPVHNGGQFYRLYPENFNMASQWTAGIVDGQTYSQYSGCSVNVGSGTWLVRGFDTTYSVDSDKDGVGNTDEVETDDSYGYNIVTPRGEVVFLACEETAYGGTIFAAGGVFLSDFEVKAELDNIWDLPYANRTIFENILGALCATDQVTDIADIRTAELNKIFVIEGYVTNGTVNVNTTFFDAIYVQDKTGGTTVFPYSTEGLAIGTKVRIIGYTDAYQDDRELQVLSLKILDAEPNVYEPKALSTKDAMDYAAYGGQLVSTTGVVSDIIRNGSVISQFKLTDSTGVAATVFIDGYITNESGVNSIGEWIRNGDTVSAAGLLYMHPEGDSDVSVPVLRVRNCDEVVLVSAAPETPTPVIPTYRITVSGTENGSVSVSSSAAANGAVITVTVIPDEGYELEALTVTAGGASLALTDKGDGKYTFTMPASGVTVSASFRAVHACPAEKFPDVDTALWYHEAIDYVLSNGLMNGGDGGLFAPLANLSRGMMAVILYRMEGKPAVTGSAGFDDVAPGQWYTDAVNWAAASGIVRGYDNGSFGPEDDISREQMAVILYRYAQYKGYDVGAAADLSAFADGSATSAWAAAEVKWAVAEGLLNGNGAGVLNPSGTATRAEVAQILLNFARKTGK